MHQLSGKDESKRVGCSFRRKEASDDAAVAAGSRVFQARAAACGNARSPSAEGRIAWRTTSVNESPTGKRRRPSSIYNSCQLSRDYNCDSTTIRLRYDYDPTTTYRARLFPFDAIRREQKINMSIFLRSRVVVVS